MIMDYSMMLRAVLIIFEPWSRPGDHDVTERIKQYCYRLITAILKWPVARVFYNLLILHSYTVLLLILVCSYFLTKS